MLVVLWLATTALCLCCFLVTEWGLYGQRTSIPPHTHACSAECACVLSRERGISRCRTPGTAYLPWEQEDRTCCHPNARSLSLPQHRPSEEHSSMYMPCPMIHVTRKNKTDLHFKKSACLLHTGEAAILSSPVNTTSPEWSPVYS